MSGRESGLAWLRRRAAMAASRRRFAVIRLPPCRRPATANAAASALASHEPLVDHLAAIMDVGGPRLRTIGQGHEQLGQRGVAMLLDEPRYGIAAMPTARLAHDCPSARGHPIG